MSQTILVVDDDANIVRLVRSYLEQAGYAVQTASDGKTALQAVRTVRPDLVVLDLMLPEMDGLTVTRTLRADPALAATPILMLTARVEDVDRILGLEMGADDYVTKPFNPREVLARVKAILRRIQAPPATAQPILRVGDLEIDPTTHAFAQAGQILDLTPSEFDLIYLLMRHPGRAFTRTELIEEGLGYEYAGLERTIDSHIKNLRRKIEPDPRNPIHIETVFGIGYRLSK
ncbi:MAG: response regulator transcription factor [Caldilineaceae bacterium]|nr:response regulator transcription factor [Caldilineaceae bacterium]MBP8110607.1 response regulator transcription factor [Caldilineaceae bacterium]MBP9070829.1 response regulator transcription factor [Caldilineaceae bacterium]